MAKENKDVLAKVRLTHTVTVWVSADSVDEINDWMLETTPEEVASTVPPWSQEYDEEIEYVLEGSNARAGTADIVI